ncbi:MAG: MBL fold metallo-hydrolase [Spirochaetia bacterium]|nr:MBL fold metallo-hydrolase [Spirochaetia bacterium]
MAKGRITILGSGTSFGVPTIGCDCRVCTSKDPRNRRMRVSIMVESATTRIIVDTSVDFRMQMINAGIKRLDAILYTHSHADHLHGLDDVRPLTRDDNKNPQAVVCYGYAETLRDIRERFSYVFAVDPHYNNKPHLDLQEFPGQRFQIGDIPVEVIRVIHGRMPVAAFRFWDKVVYATDLNLIPEESKPAFANADIMIVGAPLRTRHPTHFSIDEALHVFESFRPTRAYLTHLSHQVEHVDFSAELVRFADNKGLGGVYPAHDGLSLEIEV